MDKRLLPARELPANAAGSTLRSPRLRLARETLRRLDDAQLARVGGRGLEPDSGGGGGDAIPRSIDHCPLPDSILIPGR